MLLNILTPLISSAFAHEMEKIGEKCAKSVSTATIEEALAAGEEIGYPVIARAGYALGGLGSGFADNKAQLEDICKKAFAVSPEVLVERSMKGWKEIEFEVVRDSAGNCITVCAMENLDPLGGMYASRWSFVSINLFSAHRRFHSCGSHADVS